MNVYLIFALVVGLTAIFSAVKSIKALERVANAPKPKDVMIVFLSAAMLLFCGAAAVVACAGWVIRHV